MTFDSKYFILAPIYHGATMLARLVDAHPLAVCLGDTYPLNEYDQTCGCGAKVSTCPFWHEIKDAVSAGRYLKDPLMLPVVPHVVAHGIDRWLFEFLPVPALTRLVSENRLSGFVGDYRHFLDAVYRHFADRRPRVFVDGVKATRRVRALLSAGERIGGILHLVRDPADFAKSKMKIDGTGGTAAFAAAVLSWRLRHQRIASLKRYVPYLRIDYEALCSDTDYTLSRIFRFMGLPPMGIEELRQHAINPWHFMGNASMFRFDWEIRASRYRVTSLERRVVDLLARHVKIDQSETAADPRARVGDVQPPRSPQF